MRILFLTQVLPYPPNAGPRIKTWNVLRFLALRGHQVTLVSYVRAEEVEFIPGLEPHVHRLVAVPMRRSRWADARAAVKAVFKRRPFLIERDDSREMRQAVARETEAGRVDVIHADQVTMTQFALPQNGVRRVFDAHNATWAIIAGALSDQPVWLQPLLAFEARAMRRYEGEVLTAFDMTLAVTEEDRHDLELAANSSADHDTQPPRIEVIPISIDTDSLQPASPAKKSCEILAYGSMHYAPNADGIAWFLESVFPMVLNDVPEVRMKVVGKSPPQRIRRLAESWNGHVEVTGFVDDLEPFFSRASVVVVPVLAGSGMRVRILEAMARGMPTVTTSLGAQGIDVLSHGAALVADDPKEFAAAVVGLLRDPELRAKLGSSGRRLAVDHYHWEAALGPLDGIYPPPSAMDRRGTSG